MSDPIGAQARFATHAYAGLRNSVRAALSRARECSNRPRLANGEAKDLPNGEQYLRTRRICLAILT